MHMTQAKEATIDVDSDDIPAEEDNSLFSKIEAGCHDGLVIHELGMAIYSIREELGIEYFVGLATHGTQEQFFQWMIKATGSGLEDWEPATVPLFECWESATDFHNDPDFQPYDYRVWSSRPSSTALTYHKVDVFALRHRSWRWLKKRQERKFFCAWSRSLAEAEWYRDNLGIRPKPTIIECDPNEGSALRERPLVPLNA